MARNITTHKKLNGIPREDYVNIADCGGEKQYSSLGIVYYFNYKPVALDNSRPQL